MQPHISLGVTNTEALFTLQLQRKIGSLTSYLLLDVEYTYQLTRSLVSLANILLH